MHRSVPHLRTIGHVVCVFDACQDLVVRGLVVQPPTRVALLQGPLPTRVSKSDSTQPTNHICKATSNIPALDVISCEHVNYLILTETTPVEVQYLVLQLVVL